jgi:pyridoxine 5-phosphate synthase
MTSYIRLGVNIDHVATLRNARGGMHPDPFTVAVECVKAGADGITIHLREDRRHIRDADAEKICKEISAPINFEMAATEEMTAIACRLKPHGVCIVPEKRQEITTEGGLDVVHHEAELAPLIARLNAAGIVVSLFVDPDYANGRPGELERLGAAAMLTAEIGLECHAGHGLTYANVTPIAALPQVRELNIGHYLMGEALLVGLPATIRHMKDLMAKARGG